MGAPIDDLVERWRDAPVALSWHAVEAPGGTVFEYEISDGQGCRMRLVEAEWEGSAKRVAAMVETLMAAPAAAAALAAEVERLSSQR